MVSASARRTVAPRRATTPVPDALNSGGRHSCKTGRGNPQWLLRPIFFMNNKLHIHILASSEVDVSASVKKLLISSIRKHATKTARILFLSNPYNITLYPNSNWVIPHTGENGYAPTKDWLQLSIDLTGKTHKVNNLIQKRLPATIYHEMNHLKRWSTVGYGHTLLEEIISEGLACSFEHKMWQTDQVPFYLEDEKNILKMLVLVKKQLAKKDQRFSHADWFFGTNPKIPKWLGYKLGFYIVEKALANAPKKTIVDLTSLSSAEILKMSKLF